MTAEPIFEAEIVGRHQTIRATVDVAEDGPFGMLAMEPNEGLLRQQVVPMTEEDWARLEAMSADAGKALRSCVDQATALT